MSDPTDTRPGWNFTEMSEADFRRVYRLGRIKSVEAKWEMTGADTSREWLVVQNEAGVKTVLLQEWARVWSFVGRSSVPGLFKLNYTGDRMRIAMDAIDKWEADNASDRAEFDRLRRKFGGADE